jgi:colanic acid/amylovoran biosynthesis glycosyltransferase
VKLAYFTNQYPKASHAFIRREILAMEAAGHEIVRISVRRTGEDLVDERDRREWEKTRVLLDAGIVPLLAAGCWTAVTCPVRFGRAVGAAWGLARCGSRRAAWYAMYLLEACLLKRWLTQEKVDHMHVHFGTNPAAVAMLCRILGGPTYSVTVHGPEEFDEGRTMGLDRKARWASLMVGISHYGCGQLAQWVGGGDRKKIRRVHCGVDEVFLEMAPTAVPEKPRLVFVGRLTATKGVWVLLEALARLHGKGVDVELTVIGDGPERGKMEELVRSKGLAGKVQMVGWAGSQRVREEIVKSRALVLPSFAEGLPVVLMESLALGRPVITTGVAGIPELVEDEVNGWLVPPGSVEALADAMGKVLKMPAETLTRMGLTGREKVLREHNAATEAAKLVELIREAIERHPENTRDTKGHAGLIEAGAAGA